MSIAALFVTVKNCNQGISGQESIVVKCYSQHMEAALLALITSHCYLL